MAPCLSYLLEILQDSLLKMTALVLPVTVLSKLYHDRGVLAFDRGTQTARVEDRKHPSKIIHISEVKRASL